MGWLIHNQHRARPLEIQRRAQMLMMAVKVFTTAAKQRKAREVNRKHRGCGAGRGRGRGKYHF